MSVSAADPRTHEPSVTGQSHLPAIGFIGLGVMGCPMAENLLKAGYPMTVHTRSQQRADTLINMGANWSHSPGAAAAVADVVITMLPDSPDVVAVARGRDGLFSGARPGLGWIDMSSISPIIARDLADEAQTLGVHALDAPVSGGEIGAREATLTIMVGGPADVLIRFRPILACLGTNIVHVGDSGAGQVAKACNQVIVGGSIALVAEALVLGAKAGVNPMKIREALLGGFAESRVLDVHGERMLNKRFDPGFRIALHQKDLAIGIATARSVGAAVPITSLVSQLMNALAADGGAELDHSALVTVYERLAATGLHT